MRAQKCLIESALSLLLFLPSLRSEPMISDSVSFPKFRIRHLLLGTEELYVSCSHLLPLCGVDRRAFMINHVHSMNVDALEYSDSLP
jgi:hypothetical protein